MDYINPPITYVPLDNKPPQRLTNFLDFLPEKVVLIGSCNGLLCCRSRILGDLPRSRTRSPTKELLIYICNPHSKELIALRRRRIEVKDTVGFAFYLFGSSSNGDTCFKLVSIDGPKGVSNVHFFSVYSSETGQWKRSEDVCCFNFKIRKNKMILVGSRCYWLTWEHHIIIFDIETELSAIIKLPGPIMKGISQGICLGVSRGCLHYICAHVSKVRVWILKDNGTSEWILKHNLNLSHFFRHHEKRFGSIRLKRFEIEKLKDETVYSSIFIPLAYSEEVLFMKVGRRLYSYDFRTAELKGRYWLKGDYLSCTPTVLPYFACLAADGVLEELPLGPKNGKESIDSSMEPKQKKMKIEM